MELQGPGIGPLSLMAAAAFHFFFFGGIESAKATEAPAPIQNLRVLLKRIPVANKTSFSGFDVETARGEGKSDRRVRELREENQASVSTSCEGLRDGEFRSIQSRGGFLRWEGKSLRGEVRLAKVNSECLVINVIDIESYVAGLLNSEMAGNWPLESLKAQAVAARTYAVFIASRNQERPFDLESTVKDQVYHGAHREMYQTHLATRMTKDEILTFQGKVVKAFYHSTCAGRTEIPVNVWGEEHAVFRSVPCPYCKKSPRYGWGLDVSLKSLEKSIGYVLALRVLDKTPSGRAKTMEIALRLQKTLWPELLSAPLKTGPEAFKLIHISVQKFRELLGFDRVKSNAFEIESVMANSPWVRIKGRGAGHGVGMCQWGAKEMATQGKGYRSILKQYYPLATLQRKNQLTF